MDLGEWIARYGYVAVFLGTAIEGETVLVLGGFAAHRGHLALGGVVGSAFLATLLTDQALFYLGRRHGAAWLVRRPGWRPRVDRMRRLVERNQTKLALGFRFMYGLRMVTPFALGLSPIPAARFVALNVASAIVWALCFGALGWALGSTFERLLGDLERYEAALFVGLALAGVAWSLLRRRRAHALARG